MPEAIGGEAENNAESIAEIIIEAGADHALRQGVAHITHALSHFIPHIRHHRCRRRALQFNEDGGLARDSVAPQPVEIRCFL